MTTVKNVGTIVTPRDRELLRTLVMTRVLDGDQIKTICGFTSVRRTNRRLLKLVQAGLLKRWFVGTASGGQKAFYGLSPQGAHLIGEAVQRLIPWKRDLVVTSSHFLDHQMAINSVFILARYCLLPVGVRCEKWLRLGEPISASVQLVPDGYLELLQGNAAYSFFLEADLGTESSSVWKKKVEGYLRFGKGPEFERLFGRDLFRVLVVFRSERRLQEVRRRIAARTDRLFLFTTLEQISKQGLCGPVWLRAKAAEGVPLP